jgi:dTDP-4-amino-4,6-dideoxygalactose transaminase
MQPHEQLEHEFGEWAGVKNVVACSSGTAALHLALEALELPRGAKVLVPDFTMVACARAVTLAGLVPVFVDCGEDMLISIDQLEQAVYKLNGEAHAIMPVHVYGRRCHMAAIYQLASRFDLYVVEDMAEAHGVPVHPGTDAACWSFYKNKIVAGEEGGAVSFQTTTAAKLARSLRSLGFGDSQDYQHTPRGHNYRLASCLAEKVLKSLGDFGEGGILGEPGRTPIDYRRKVEQCYNDWFPTEWKLPHRDAPWVYDIRIPGLHKYQQDMLVEGLNKEGIAARHAFKPMSSQREYSGCEVFREKRSRGVADVVSQEVIYYPLGSGTTPEMVERAYRITREVVHG